MNQIFVKISEERAKQIGGDMPFVDIGRADKGDLNRSRKIRRGLISENFSRRNRRLIMESKNPIETIKQGELSCEKCFFIEDTKNVCPVTKFEDIWNEYKGRPKLEEVKQTGNTNLKGNFIQGLSIKLKCGFHKHSEKMCFDIGNDVHRELKKETWNLLVKEARKLKEEEDLDYLNQVREETEEEVKEVK